MPFVQGYYCSTLEHNGWSHPLRTMRKQPTKSIVLMRTFQTPGIPRALSRPESWGELQVYQNAPLLGWCRAFLTSAILMPEIMVAAYLNLYLKSPKHQNGGAHKILGWIECRLSANTSSNDPRIGEWPRNLDFQRAFRRAIFGQSYEGIRSGGLRIVRETDILTVSWISCTTYNRQGETTRRI